MGRILLILIFALLALAETAPAQQGFSSVWYWFDNGTGEVPLTDSCISGTPLLDGTTVYIFWDNDSNGPDDDDPLPTLCDNNWPPGNPPCVNRNTFELNGEFFGLGAGWFAMDGISFSSLGPFTPSRFYLRVCAVNIYWESNIVTLPPGPSEVGPGLWIPLTFTCIPVRCPNCFPPQPPQNVLASDGTQCDGVTVSWIRPDDPLSRNESWISRDDQFLIAIPESLATSYVDTTAEPGAPHSYSVVEVRFCIDPGDTLFSATASDIGYRMPYPPTPYDLQASNDQFNQVTVTWAYDSNTGLDHWIIFRDGTNVGTLGGSGAPGLRSFVHLNPPSGPALYDVFGVNSVCTGTPSLPDTGEALGTNADDETIQLPSSFTLSSYPNPFNTVTSVRYELPRTEVVRLIVYDLAGKTSAVLVDGTQPAGIHDVSWDAQGFPSGMYVVRLQAGTVTLASKLLLLK